MPAGTEQAQTNPTDTARHNDKITGICNRAITPEIRVTLMGWTSKSGDINKKLSWSWLPWLVVKMVKIHVQIDISPTPGRLRGVGIPDCRDAQGIVLSRSDLTLRGWDQT